MPNHRRIPSRLSSCRSPLQHSPTLGFVGPIIWPSKAHRGATRPANLSKARRRQPRSFSLVDGGSVPDARASNSDSTMVVFNAMYGSRFLGKTLKVLPQRGHTKRSMRKRRWLSQFSKRILWLHRWWSRCQRLYSSSCSKASWSNQSRLPALSESMSMEQHSTDLGCR